MAYKKYIKRGGKVYGPYIYHSKRIGGKVVSEYHGTHSKKIDFKKFLWIGLGVLILAVLIFGVSFLEKRISGQATFDVTIDYKEGEAIDGVLKLLLKEGELIPTSSKLVLENNGEKYEYPLSEVIFDEIIEGDFYVEGKTISGTGEGYGISGDKEISPTVYFTLEIYSGQERIDEPEELEEPIQEVTEEAGDTSLQNPEESPIEEESFEETIEDGGESIEPIEEATPIITGGTISSFFGWLGTGNVIMELQREIEGQVSIDNPFIYTLEEDETVEIKPKSVKTNLEEINDNVLDIKIENNELIITTDYLDNEEGFGEEYLGDNTKDFNIDLSDLNLVLGEGELKISLIYSEEELISLTTILQEGKTSGAQIQGEPIQEPIQEEVEVPQEIKIPEGVNLTKSERAILLKKFGSININTIRQDVEDGRLKIGSQLVEDPSYTTEYTYEYPQTTEALKIQIEADRTKWLKDIAASLLKKEKVPEEKNIVEFSTNFSQ
ncbi:hypothetical protein KAI04_00685 [Candidatus Pacearchaeota archaeon]|nr:hypothetical protein [Candidatus Pacearchaeota archaeon]